MENIRKNMLCAVLPFATWIGLQSLLPTTALAYAIRTLATTIVGIVAYILLGRHLPPPSSPTPTPNSNSHSPTPTPTPPPTPTLNLLISLTSGLIVCLLWIAPDSCTWYRTWLCWPIGSLPEVPTASPYDPAVCGWTLTIIKLIGSAFVIAPVEEVFFRSFLYRWLQNRDFAAVPLSRFDLSAFLWTVFLFTLEHDRPIAAAMAGVAYGLLAIRCGLGSAIIAHVVTNLALGLHVIYHGQWAFW